MNPVCHAFMHQSFGILLCCSETEISSRVTRRLRNENLVLPELSHGSFFVRGDKSLRVRRQKSALLCQQQHSLSLSP